MIEKLAKAIKRSNKKKNVNVTLGLIIGFLLSSGTIYGDTTDGKDIFIKESKEYNNDTTLKHDGGQLISTWNGASSNSITLDAGKHNLTLIHKTDTPYLINKDSLADSNNILYSSVIADRGDLTIKAKKIALNSEIFVKDISPIDDISIEGSSLRNGITVIGDTTIGNETKAVLEAEEININVKGNGILSGIALYQNYSPLPFNTKVEIKAKDFKLNVEADGFAQGIDVTRGTVDIVSENTEIVANSSFYRAEGVAILYGDINFKSENIHINTYLGKSILTEGDTYVGTASGIVAYNSDAKVNIEGKNVNISTKSESVFKDGVYAVGISSCGIIKIKSDNLVIDTECVNGAAQSISTMQGIETIINSKNTILKTTGKSTFSSNEGVLFPVVKTTGISTMFNGITEINGGLEMYQIGKKEDILSIRAAAKGIVTINKNNENVAVKINDKMLADGGTINLNLNGAESYFRGQASIVAYNDNIPPSFPSDEFNGLVGNINLGISNGAIWQNEGDSKITNLTFNNGIIDMTYESGKQTIEIDKISGNNGRIVMDISPDDANQKGNKTDYIKISDGGKQTHYIETGEKSILALKDYDFTNNILIGEAAKDVTLKGNYFANIENIYEYNLDLESQKDATNSNKNNWYVTGIREREGTVIEGVMDDLSLHYMNAGLARMEADTLHKRLGDIRDLKEGAGAWARVTSGQMESHKDGYFKNDYTMIQAGIDKSEPSETGIWTTGLAVQRREGKADFRNGDGKNRSMGIALYKSWVGNDNQYLDLVGKYSHLKNVYKTYNVKNEKMEAKYHTNAGTLSLEYGKRLSKEKWYVQPHAQMTYTWIEGKNYLTTSGIRAEQKDINSLIGKAGIYAGYDFGRSSHFVKAGVLHEFMGDYGVTIKGADASVTKNVDGKDSWIEIGIGGDIKVGKTDSMNVYYELEKTFGGDFETNWQATLGMRYKF